ncbi:hypothetical protein H7J87_15080 [Mycolicibacterium wolinskyi]|uniref:Exonuclease domain-containing protein n=1 Tax=Mycolicibacterium wolinskyi TaxID=59750 RepID=A0A1X2F8B7_9MYCO|nr:MULTISPECIES: hypothetical protein [Mycolicibacterium]MCV7286651.1 hypothetical protein [Mycolicibacterium wolinskyi]MCV7293631.1 hypothetical protein [Mycolicibacterium goodii]ORX14644.1 hypothetical protein AWC31_26045 [Mycolicibacterium wolinskyi]
MRPLVFLDTETTGLHRDRQPWEIALIRRDDAGDTRIVLYIDVADLDLAAAEPAGLRISRFSSRHPQVVYGSIHLPSVYRERDAAAIVREWTLDATIVGVVPSFDTYCLTTMLARHHLSPAWCPDVVDVVPMAARIIRRCGRIPETDHVRLSQQCGVRPPGASHRHTALGDARWAMRWYDNLDARLVNEVAR